MQKNKFICLVDSGSISIMKGKKKHGDVYLPEGRYTRKIEDTWNGTIQGSFYIFEPGYYYIGDPCSIISNKKEWDKRTYKYLIGKDKKELEINKLKDDIIIIDNMGGDGDYLLELHHFNPVKHKQINNDPNDN